MSAHANDSNIWTWQNQTDQFPTELDLETACSAAPIQLRESNHSTFDLHCFTRSGKNTVASKLEVLTFNFAVNGSYSGATGEYTRSFHPWRCYASEKLTIYSNH